MRLQSFLKKNSIDLSPAQLRLIEAGVASMKQSKDVLHPVDHIERIYEMYALYKAYADEEGIDPAVFMTAVAWHDVWKARRGTRGFVGSVYAQVVEGLCAARTFRLEAQRFGVEDEFIAKVTYAIRKHSQIQFLRPVTNEALLLRDLDLLDKWDVRRLSFVKDARSIKGVGANRMGRSDLYWKLRRKKKAPNKSRVYPERFIGFKNGLFKTIFFWYMKMDNAGKINFPWLRKEFSHRRQTYFKKLNEFYGLSYK